ncbi:proteophosphoglycan ppg4, partial [Reticulomyxa filosa]
RKRKGKRKRSKPQQRPIPTVSTLLAKTEKTKKTIIPNFRPTNPSELSAASTPSSSSSFVPARRTAIPSIDFVDTTTTIVSASASTADINGISLNHDSQTNKDKLVKESLIKPNSFSDSERPASSVVVPKKKDVSNIAPSLLRSARNTSTVSLPPPITTANENIGKMSGATKASPEIHVAHVQSYQQEPLPSSSLSLSSERAFSYTKNMGGSGYYSTLGVSVKDAELNDDYNIRAAPNATAIATPPSSATSTLVTFSDVAAFNTNFPIADWIEKLRGNQILPIVVDDVHGS